MDITFKFESDLSQEAKEWIVAAIDDAIAQFQAKAQAAAQRSLADIAALKAENEQLKAQAASGSGATQAAIDTLNNAGTLLDQIDPTTPTTLPTSEPIPVPSQGGNTPGPATPVTGPQPTGPAPPG